MIISLFGRSLNEHNAQTVYQLLHILEKQGIEAQLFAPLNEQLSLFPGILPRDYKTFHTHNDLHKDTHFLMSVGGDGTFLNSINIIRDSGIPVVGINTGRLGFLATIAEPELTESVEKLLAGELPTEERTLLKINMKDAPFHDFPYALNDMVIQKRDNGLITVHTWIDDEFLNSYWADGLIISTPTGSSAYSLSVGGPVVTPDSENFIISPVAPHNLTVRPLVIPDKSVLRFKTECRDTIFTVTLDSRSVECICGTEFTLEKADFKIKVIKFSSFFTTLRNKLMWGADKRN